MIIRIQLLAENQFKNSTFPSINIPSFQDKFLLLTLKNFVRSGIRTHASKWRPEHSYTDSVQGLLESGALDRSAILTWI